MSGGCDFHQTSNGGCIHCLSWELALARHERYLAVELLGEVVDWFGVEDWTGPQIPVSIAARISACLADKSAPGTSIPVVYGVDTTDELATLMEVAVPPDGSFHILNSVILEAPLDAFMAQVLRDVTE
jgi:hypothetical protein